MRNIILAACALVAACNATTPDARVCTGAAKSAEEASAVRAARQSTDKTPAARYETERAYVDDCLRRWSYVLAESDGSSSEVAASVVEACAEPMASLRMAAARLTEARWVDEQTGEPVTLERAIAQRGRTRAIFYMVQGRLGRCR